MKNMLKKRIMKNTIIIILILFSISCKREIKNISIKNSEWTIYNSKDSIPKHFFYILKALNGDEKIADKKPSKPKEVDHDKFNDDGDFSQDKKEAQVEALSEKVRNEDNKKDSVSNNEENNIIKETSAIKITGAKDKKINISIDVENITGKDIEALKEFISTL